MTKNKLIKLVLAPSKKNNAWELKKEKTNEVIKTFETKQEALSRNVIKKALGGIEASVKIKKLDNSFQEERTYPKSSDPKKSKG